MLLLLGLSGTHAGAQEAPVIGELSSIDRQYMQRQRDGIAELAAQHFGVRFSGTKDNDLGLLQRLLDEQVVVNQQTRELQAMGVILGDLLAAEYGLHWVIYSDKLGRSHALRYRDSDNYLFPVTMISRRREAGNLTPVADIYARAGAAISESIPALPFQ
ncbi:DUF3806 domain-containing protein [Mangrovimicrobium sediminis]|uniref:DUF3806 domain-containing protein n=1 Tax=Mangrovimicrobium sediminis TaxID=2562682 RepID=A0A4Z0LYE5_9GAMM|nr:DUF3806 domain-containing protein [Haliea sp. SAOS-164]